MSALQALLAAAMFGLSVPLAKRLLDVGSPLFLAGLLYLGAGLFLTGVRAVTRSRRSPRPLEPRERVILVGVVLTGGVLAPPLLLWGLARAPASAASLLLNLEVVFTVVLAGAIFHEHLGTRVVAASVMLAAGGIVLGWPSGHLDLPIASAAVAGACLLWAIDNNLTRVIADADALLVAQRKGLAAGVVNVALSLAAGHALPPPASIAISLVVGAVGYGTSLVLFIMAMRGLGAARTGAYFALAPFFGALAGVALLGEPVTAPLTLTAALMAGGVWLLLRERHSHRHRHEAGMHTHRHVHDQHHQHQHEGWEGPEPHMHPHATGPLEHDHPHIHDGHHGHDHD
ncbi:MAG TPA: DMT family transporter [Methylomirabilota bacterium]|jgi:drug/metabolite transporter (DMT)-like permease|nr:DMT family transporter [Methylomirabilota bacterium]